MEMIFALAIGAIMVTPLYFVTRSIAQQTDAQRMDIEATQRARLGLAALAQDLNRSGLQASPNTIVDTAIFANSSITDSTARLRSAVVHLNRLQSGNDAIMLSGNFLGSKIYNGRAIAENVVQLEGLVNRSECIEQFDRNFGFANITNKLSGKKLDARVLSASFGEINGDKVCDLTLRFSDLSAEVLTAGSFVAVSANQTAIYWVETLEDRNQLVRYFVDYDSNNMPGDCSIAGITTPSGLDSAIPGSIVPATRKVIADYVENFQVWLRPVSLINDGTVPHYYLVSDLALQSDTTFANGYLPRETEVIFPLNASSTTSNVNDVSCSETGYTFGAENLRSAVVLLTVRNEMTDQVIDITAFNQPDSRIIRHNLAAYTGEGDRAGACYKLKTLVTEVPLVNISSRKDLVH